MAKVIYTAFAEIKLKQLINTLYDEEYFGFVAAAESYVNSIYDFIDSLPHQRKNLCYNPARGTWYCRYQHNRKTFWFITFDTDGEIFIIRDIINNHSADYPQFISG